MHEELFEIAGPDGMYRRGVVSLPRDTRAATTGVLLLPAGLKYHVGPHRYYVKLARYLAAEGYIVLRFDPLGVGESDGLMQKGPTREIWQSIETGRYVEDVLLAAARFRKQYGLAVVAAGGICGAAVTALLAAATPESGIDGVISINTAVSLSATQGGAAKIIGSSQADHNFRSYLRKVFSLDAWKRVFARESDFTSIRRTLFTKVCSVLHFGLPATGGDNDKVNRSFIKALHTVRKRGIRHLLVFSGNDNRWFEFRDMVLSGEPSGNMESVTTQISLIRDANHELHLREWQDESMGVIRTWLSLAVPNRLAP